MRSAVKGARCHYRVDRPGGVEFAHGLAVFDLPRLARQYRAVDQGLPVPARFDTGDPDEPREGQRQRSSLIASRRSHGCSQPA